MTTFFLKSEMMSTFIVLGKKINQQKLRELLNSLK